MDDETNVTRLNARSMSYLGGTEAVRSVMSAIFACWPNAKLDRKDSTGVWGNAIDGLTGDQIRHGIRQISLLPTDFPPSPGKFRELCLTFRRESTWRPPLEDHSPRKEANREVILANLKTLGQHLKAFIPPKRESGSDMALRLHHEACEHDWAPHHYYDGDHCRKCGQLEVETADAWRNDVALKRE